MNRDQPEQQDLLPGLVRSARAKPGPKPRKAVEIAEVDPVARVLVDVPLAHLDRPFDYAVPATMAENIAPGVRVKVRFAGQDVDGYVVARAASSDHSGRLTPVRRVVSAEPVLSAEVAELTAAVAQRYAGTRSDVLRLAVPPRHATAEKAAPLAATTARRDRSRLTSRRSGPTISRVRRSSRASFAAIVSAPCGRRRRPRTGPPCCRPPRPRRTPEVAAR